MKRAVLAVICVSVLALVLSGWRSGAAAAEQNVRLGDVVVTATKTEKNPKDITQTVTVISGDELRKSGAATVADAIDTVAGITLNDQGALGSLETISIRGASYSQVLVLLDGKRLNSPSDAGFDLSTLPIPISQIDRIEIVRGASSALYGTDALGGVINIITKKPTGTAFLIGGSVGSHGYDSLSATSEGRDGSGYHMISWGRETYDGYRPNSDLRQQTVNGKVGTKLQNGSNLEFTANYLSKEIGAPGSVQFPSTTARQWDRERIYGATYTAKPEKTVDLTLSAFRNEDDLSYQDPASLFGPVNSRHESTTDGSEMRLSWLAGSWSLFTAGLETRRSNLDSTDSGIHASSNNATYIQDEISFGDSFILVAGERFDNNSLYGSKSSPRLSGRYLIQGWGTIIRASYGTSFRGPTFNDLYWTDPFGNKGNPDLKPETAREREAGIEQPLGTAGMIKVTWFDRTVRELINWQEYAPFQYTPVNIGTASIKGYEAESRLKAGDSLTLAANYTYMNPIDELTGEKIYYTIPRSQIKGQLTIKLDTDTFLNIDGRSVTNYVRGGEPDWRYSVYEAKISQKIGRDRTGEIYFAMSNIFDRKYESVQGYPMPPREIRGGIMVPY